MKYLAILNILCFVGVAAAVTCADSAPLPPPTIRPFHGIAKYDGAVLWNGDVFDAHISMSGGNTELTFSTPNGTFQIGAAAGHTVEISGTP